MIEGLRAKRLAGVDAVTKDELGNPGTIGTYISQINKHWREEQVEFKIASVPQERDPGQIGPTTVKYRLERVVKEDVALNVGTQNGKEEDETIPDSRRPLTTEPGKIASETEETLNPQLSGAEIYRLGQKLQNGEEEVLNKLGIRLPAEDREAIAEVLQRLGSFPDVIEASEKAGETLVKKLNAFIEDKQTVFMANIEDEDAQFLLTFLAGIDSGDKIAQLLVARSIAV